MKINYFFTDLYYDSAAPAVAGFKKALSEAASGGVNDIVLCVSQLSALGGTFSEAFGHELANELMRKGIFRFQGINYYLATKKKKIPRLSRFVVFGIETKPEEMEQFSQNGSVMAIIYMPLHKSELDVFKRLHPEANYIKTDESDKRILEANGNDS